MTEQSASPARAPRILMNPPVFITSAVLTLVFVLFAAIFTETAGTVFSAVQGWISDSAGWFYVLAVAGFVVFMVGVAVSSYGNIKLGPDHSQPDYSYASWFAMLFSAGMGIGLMFFGVAEPVMHYVSPPVGDPETVEAPASPCASPSSTGGFMPGPSMPWWPCPWPTSPSDTTCR